jgi:hypothetical protein
MKSPKEPSRKQVIETAKIVRRQSINLKLGFLKSNAWGDGGTQGMALAGARSDDLDGVATPG